MKIRSGFVSNSSSSSFVLAIAEVTNEEKIRAYIEEKKISYNAEIVAYEDFEVSSWYGRKVTENAQLNKEETVISIESFDGSTVSLPYDKTKKYFAYRMSQDCDCNEDGETIFDESVCEEIDTIAENAEGIGKLKVTSGCGYNG